MGCFTRSAKVQARASSQIAVRERGSVSSPAGASPRISSRAYPPLKEWKTADVLDWVQERDVGLSQLAPVVQARQLTGVQLIQFSSSEADLGKSLQLNDSQALLRARLFQLVSALKKPPAPPPQPPEFIEAVALQSWKADKKAKEVLAASAGVKPPAGTAAAPAKALEKGKEGEKPGLNRVKTTIFNPNGEGKLPRGVDAYKLLQERRRGLPVFHPFPGSDGQWKLMHIYDTGIKGEEVRYEIKIPAMIGSGNSAAFGNMPMYSPIRNAAPGTHFSAPASQSVQQKPSQSSPSPPPRRPSQRPAPAAPNGPAASGPPRPAAAPAPAPRPSVSAQPMSAPAVQVPPPSQLSHGVSAPVGVSRAKFCPQCGQSNTAQGKFCLHCGSAIPEVSAPAQPAAYNPPAMLPGAVNVALAPAPAPAAAPASAGAPQRPTITIKPGSAAGTAARPVVTGPSKQLEPLKAPPTIKIGKKTTPA